MTPEDSSFPVLKRSSVPELDAILGRPFKVLNDGFVRVIDYMGTDASIVQAARVSYGEGTTKTSNDEHLIRYLLRHRHTTPMEMCEIKFHVRVPMDVWRQWIRHRTASINEYSTRYSIAIDSMYTTSPEGWREQSTTNRQGSAESFDSETGTQLTKQETKLHAECRRVYQDRINRGVAREQARKDLPLSTYTEAYWKCNLHNLLHFLSLRMDSAAQLEIRDYATTIGHRIVAKWVPFTWKAFRDYTIEAMSFSRHEQVLFSHIFKNEPEDARTYARKNNLERNGKPGREIREFETKLLGMSIPSPWA